MHILNKEHILYHKVKQSIENKRLTSVFRSVVSKLNFIYRKGYHKVFYQNFDSNLRTANRSFLHTPRICRNFLTILESFYCSCWETSEILLFVLTLVLA